MDVDKMREETFKKKKKFHFLPKKSCVLILFDFEKPLKKKKYKDTEYIFYGCRVLKCDDRNIEYGSHIIQLPMKTAWLQLFDYLDRKKLRKTKNICLKYVKLNKYHYCWTSENPSGITKLLYYDDAGVD